MDVTAQWKGTIIYGKNYRQLAGNELCFEMRISQEGKQIEGVCVDTSGFGGSPDHAAITGSFSEDEISFKKQYSRLHYYHKGKTKIDDSRPDHVIDYSGQFDEKKQTFSGEWIIRSKAYLFGIFPSDLLIQAYGPCRENKNWC